MKKIFFYFVILITLIIYKAYAGPGEFIVVAPTYISVTATVSGIAYAWDKDATRVTYYQGPVEMTTNVWDAPTDIDDNPVMPWGYIHFTIRDMNNHGYIISEFSIDFRDQNWAFEYYPNHDTRLIINPETGVYTLNNAEGDILTQVWANGVYNIWDVWGRTKDDSHFGAPVYVENRSGSTNLGGSFKVGYQGSIPSGEYGVFSKGVTSSTVGTNNERFNTYTKHLHWNDNNGDYLIRRTVSVDLPEIADFEMLQPATITVSSSEVPSLSNIYLQFNDPWYLVNSITGWQGNDFASAYAPLSRTSTPMTGAYNQTKGGVFLNQGADWQPPYYSVSFPSNQTVSVGGTNHLLYFQNWISSGANFQDVNSATTGVVFTNSGTTVQANLKGTQLSNNANAFANNSQRKIIETSDGTLYSTYESMGSVWLESKSENGTSVLENNGKPFNSANSTAKNPSLFTDGQTVLLTFQEIPSGSTSSIIKLISYYKGLQQSQTVGSFSISNTSALNLNPSTNFSFATPYSSIVTIWEQSGNIKCAYGYVEDGPITHVTADWKSTIESLHTGACSSPSMAVDADGRYHLIYVNNYNIEYIKFVFYTNHINDPDDWSINIMNEQNLSTGSYSFNSSPSIVALPDGWARCCWLGQSYPGSSSTVVFRSSNYYHFWYFGSNARTPQVTKSDDNTSYFVIWNEVSGNSTKFTDNATLSNIYDLNTTGQAVQLSNGVNKNYMYASVYNNQTQPYFFKTSPSIGSKYGLQKSSIASNLNIGRGASIVKDSIGFFFMLKNIAVDNQPVDFIKTTDTTVIDNLTDLNAYLISQPFTMNDNSGINFEIHYGITLQNAEVKNVSKLLDNNNSISYILDLADAESGKTLINMAKIEFDENNLPKFEEQAYKLNPKGIGGNKNVCFKITTGNNFNGKCLLTESYSDVKSDNLAKVDIKGINYKDLVLIKDYALDQNYPNPFNPTTSINYQIPKDGFVTLKIYDVLGKEVAVLVNENKATGKYSVEFNAGKLASGVYLYQVKVNDFVSTKKLVLLK